MKALADCRILVVEDEVLIAMDVERMLLQEGCTVVGPIGTVARALSAIPGGKIDAAILDVNLGRETVFPVAELLAESKTPFVLVSGHSPESLPETLRDYPVIGKPYQRNELINGLLRALSRTSDGA
jgi:DNA-binding response OmpR family regulator